MRLKPTLARMESSVNKHAGAEGRREPPCFLRRQACPAFPHRQRESGTADPEDEDRSQPLHRSEAIRTGMDASEEKPQVRQCARYRDAGAVQEGCFHGRGRVRG